MVLRFSVEEELPAGPDCSLGIGKTANCKGTLERNLWIPQLLQPGEDGLSGNVLRAMVAAALSQRAIQFHHIVQHVSTF